MTPEEKAEQYADSHNLKCASDSHAFVEVSLRQQWEHSRDAFLAGHQSRDEELKELQEDLRMSMNNSAIKLERITALKEEVKRLREALEWYADGIYPGDESYVGNELRNGKRARAALASQGEVE